MHQACSSYSHSFLVNKTWDGSNLDHEAHKVTLESQDSNCVIMKVDGKFFNDPPAPNSEKGATDELYNYEVIEAFFLNEEDCTYLEVEVGPHGHHLVLFLDGRKNIIKKKLPMLYEANIYQETSRWRGIAQIPVEYFPPKVTKFNAFAIHGSHPNIQYEELYPQVEPKTYPDFHRLQDFQPIDFTKFLPDNQERAYSEIWSNARKNPENCS